MGPLPKGRHLPEHGGQVTKAQKKAAAEAHAAAHGPTGDAWPFGPSGRTYGRARLTLKEVEQAAAAAIVPEPRYAKTRPHGIGKWVPRSEPVIARDGSAFWVVNEHGRVVLAHWVLYPRGGTFQNMGGNDEGMCGFAVAFYQPINKPEAPNI